MKKILILIFMLCAITYTYSRGYSTSRYYQHQYQISDQFVTSWYGYDDYGYRCRFVKYKRAKWYSEYGGHTSYYWYNNCWQSAWREGYVYRYTWTYYTKRYYN